MKTKILINDIVPFAPTHPGELIADELKARGLKQKELAMLLNMPASVLNDVIKAKRSVTAEMAVLLEKVMEIPADYWMKLQSQYNIDLANMNERVVKQKKNIEIWNIIAQYVPVKLLEKIGLLGKNIDENIKKIWKIFDVDSVDGLISKYSIEEDISYFKKSERIQTDPVNLFAWKHLAYHYSKMEDVIPVFNAGCMHDLIKELNEIFYENCDTIKKTKNLLNSYGIKFIILEKFDKTPIDGFSFWKGDNPTIVLTLRLDKIDNFAFSVLHEICHVFYHLNKDEASQHVTISGAVTTSEYEDAANLFARRAIIPDDKWDKFMKTSSRISPHAMQHVIHQFAEENRINTAIVLGLYQHAINLYSIKTSFVRTIN